MYDVMTSDARASGETTGRADHVNGQSKGLHSAYNKPCTEIRPTADLPHHRISPVLEHTRMPQLYRAASMLLAISLVASASNAQDTRSKSTGFTIGGGLLGSSVSTSSDNTTVTESGGGLNVEAGWGFTPQLTAFLGINGSTIDGDTEYTLGQADLGVRYLFRTTDKQARPYLEGALAARQIRLDVTDGADDLTIKANSPGFSLGGGVQVFFTPKFALDLGVGFTLGSFSEWTANGVDVPFPDVDATSTNVRVGVRFWPMSR